ncbi:hypothetical protein CLV86_1773 [Lacinutrix venerupis]|uniref:hypothetical protein n=1 Tax=Lacinutrix venerupis TaxID=1486034 RepID=UPI000EAD76C4|nr:hypothetical protein [Lacinutrix venerupis]RLJ63237.1 hypothetical protein CLV86_1773 [Lacinutrix venerupis]
MKKLLLIFAVLIINLVSAQDSTSVKVDAPKIVSKLMYGSTIKVENIEFKFVAVESDSRCPKGVQCVWAGEAIVLVDVFKNGKKTEQKRLVFSPTSQLQNALGNLFSSESLKVSGLNIAPYPEHGTKIKAEDYYVQLSVKN